jgi:hypothetical protein
MSLLGFDAIGRLAIGQLPGGRTTTTLTVSAGAFAIAGSAATFSVKEAEGVSTFALTGVAAAFTIVEAVTKGAFAFTGVAAALKISEAPNVGAFTLNGRPINEIILEAEGPEQFTLNGVDTILTRTGADFESPSGGIGHHLLEAERAKQLAYVKRQPPAAIDRRTTPQFEPLARPPVAPSAPLVDMAAIQEQRTAAEMQAAKAAKNRRDLEAILLLVA